MIYTGHVVRETKNLSVLNSSPNIDVLALHVKAACPDQKTLDRCDLRSLSEDRYVAITGKEIAFSYLLPTSTGGIQGTTIKSRPNSQCVVATCVWSDISTMHCGWPGKLDYQEKVLRLPTLEVLTKPELTLLHKFLLGEPHKVTAQYFGISVKAIEKRLKRIREKLETPELQHKTLTGILASLNLIGFVVAHQDWFNLRPFRHIHV